jgi:asparagine synthase (glutamine-hydrolysing)
MACLLSGGLDSSIVTGLVWQYHISHNLPPLETYSIGLENSEDLRHAKMVADHLKTKHTEIVLQEKDFLDAIPEVIRAIESYDTTTVRASIGNYLLGKYISEHSNAKVIFNGDGSDELFGGYLYLYMAPDSIEFDCEVRRLLGDMYMYDVLRSDKSISSHGLEPRTPFLDRAFVQYYLSVPQQVRFHTRNEQCEKYYLRLAFCGEHYRTSMNEVLLPNDVLWRTKEAFSDGVSVKDRSLYQIIQEFATTWFYKEFGCHMTKINPEINIFEQIARIDPVMKYVGDHLVPKTAEQYYYRWIFEKEYANQGNIVPYFWMPKYIEGVHDPSARTLDIYSGGDEDEEEPNAEQPKDGSESKT